MQADKESGLNNNLELDRDSDLIRLGRTQSFVYKMWDSRSTQIALLAIGVGIGKVSGRIPFI